METKNEKKTKVMAFGTFDLLHPGHIYYLKEAKSFGNYLVVVVARDKNVEKLKGKKPVNSEEKRLAEIKKLDFVNKAILGNEENMIQVVEEEKPDVIALGYDQNAEILEKAITEGKFKNVQIKRIKPFKEDIYKSSILNKNSKQINYMHI